VKAVVYKGSKGVAVEEVDNPKIEDPRDAIIKHTSTAICGSDLHMYEGRTVAQPVQYLDTNLLGYWKRLEMPLPLLRKEIVLSLLSILLVGTVLTALEALRVLPDR
jgi:Alcohol dehydrogenase GroES-associated/Alcohol dehydrogenase GroES-like domain